MMWLRGVGILLRKEVRDSFRTSLVYILGALFGMIMGWLFFNYLAAGRDLTEQSLWRSVWAPAFGNMNFIFLFLAPLITMRLFAEERKSHTLDLLLRSYLGHGQIITAKFLSSLVTVLFLLSLTLVFPLILVMVGYSNWTMILSGYGGVILCVMCYLAVGLFTSSLTENQILASLASFCILLGVMLLAVTANATHNDWLAQFFYYFSTPSHFEGFIRGAFQSYDFIYFASFVGFFFYLTHLSLERRNW